MARETLQSSVLDELGTRIANGEIPSGTILRTEDLEVELNVSRTVLRECLKVLESMRLIELRRRIGITVRDEASWNVFDPRVIRWRLDGAMRPQQLRSLTELRIALEPMAAKLAAYHASDEQRQQILEHGQHLVAAGQPRDSQAYLHHDIVFHSLILRASGNEMFTAFSDVIAEVLTGRTRHHLTPDDATHKALDLHRQVAESIAAGDGRGAEASMRGILDEVFQQLQLQSKDSGAAPVKPFDMS